MSHDTSLKYLATALLLCAPSIASAQRPELVIQDRAPGTKVTFSPDGRFFATLDADADVTIGNLSTAILWDATTGRMVRVLAPVNQSVGRGYEPSRATRGRDIVFSPDSRYVAAVPRSLRRYSGEWLESAPAIWEVATGRPMTSANWEQADSVLRNADVPWSSAELVAWGVVRDTASAHRLAGYHGVASTISADGRVGAALQQKSGGYVVTIHELPADREVGRLPGTRSPHTAIALSGDARLLAVDEVEGKGVELWDVQKLKRVAVAGAQQQLLSAALSFSPDDRYLAAASRDRVMIFRTDNGAALFNVSIEDSGIGVRSVAFSPDAQRIAVAGSELRIFDVASGRLVHHRGTAARIAPVTAWARSESMLAVARKRSEDVITAQTSATIELWPLDSGVPRRLGGDLFTVASLAFSPDGKMLAAGTLEATFMSRYMQGFAGSLHMWNVPDTTRYDIGEAWHAPASQVAFSRDGSYLFAARYDLVPSGRGCPYIECGEDESSNWDIWVQRVHAGSRDTVNLMRVAGDHKDYEDVDPVRIRFNLQDFGNRVLVHDSLWDISTRAAVPDFESAAFAAAAERPSVSCVGAQRVSGFTRFSNSGEQLATSNGGGISLVHAQSGDPINTPQPPLDVAIITGAFTAYDHSLVLATCSSTVPGTTLMAIDHEARALRTLAHSEHPIDDVLIAPRDFIFVRSGGTVRLHDPAGKQLATLLADENGDWLVTSPDGLYDATPAGADLAVWRTGNTVQAPSQLPDSFRIPALLQRLLRGEKLVAPTWPR